MHKTHLYLLQYVLPVALAAGVLLGMWKIAIPWYGFVLLPPAMFLALVLVGLVGQAFLAHARQSEGEKLFREEWQLALAADAGAYDHVRTVCLRSAKAAIYGWIEWYRPTKGYWQARLRFPARAKYVTQDNRPFLKDFDGLMVALAVSYGEQKVATMRSQLRLDQDDLTSTWIPVRLEHDPKEYAFVISEVNQPPNA